MTSGKRSKALRNESKAGSLNKPEQNQGVKQAMPGMPNIIGQIKINIHEDGNTSVTGFPDNYHHAASFLSLAFQAVSMHFIRLGMQGKLDENLSVSNSGRILTPQGSRIVVPGR